MTFSNKAVVGLAGGTLLLGTLVGAIATNQAAVGAASTPTPATTVTVPGPTQVKTVTHEATPQVCLDALQYADEGFIYASAALTAASNGFTAIADSDDAGLQRATDDLTTLSPKIDDVSARYRTAREACKSSF